MSDNKPLETKLSEISLENVSLKAENTELKTKLDERDHLLKQYSDIFESQEKARLAPKIKATTKLTDEDLTKMSLDEMKSIEKIIDVSKVPYKGIRLGSATGIGASDQANVTIPDKFAFGNTRKETE